jgi:hypothetical protein
MDKNNKIQMEYGTTAHNRSVYASPPVGRLGRWFYQIIPLCFIPTQNLCHSLPALEMLRISLFGLPNRRKHPERYPPFTLRFCKTSLTKCKKTRIINLPRRRADGVWLVPIGMDCIAGLIPALFRRRPRIKNLPGGAGIKPA